MVLPLDVALELRPVEVDVAQLAGARRALVKAESPDLLKNPAALYAALHWAADTSLGARVHALMPYTDLHQ